MITIEWYFILLIAVGLHFLWKALKIAVPYLWREVWVFGIETSLDRLWYVSKFHSLVSRVHWDRQDNSATRGKSIGMEFEDLRSRVWQVEQQIKMLREEKT